MLSPVFAIIDAPIILIVLLVGLLALVPAVLIARKAGYSGWLALLMLIPYAGIILYVVFALVEWPVEKEVKRLRSGAAAQQLTT